MNISYDNCAFGMVLVYRPPSSESYLMEQLAQELSYLWWTQLPTVIAGDFNMLEQNWATYAALDGSNSFVEMLVSHDFQQFIKENHVLDLICTNSSQLITDLFLQPTFGISDHMSIVFRIRTGLIEQQPII